MWESLEDGGQLGDALFVQMLTNGEEGEGERCASKKKDWMMINIGTLLIMNGIATACT